jgi:Secretion system C-terminal sorting domain
VVHPSDQCLGVKNLLGETFGFDGDALESINAFNNGISLTKVEEKSQQLPLEYHLFLYYPNPFNPETIISYSATRRSLVTVRVFNILGEQIELLVNEFKEPGTYQVTWNGTNEQSKGVSSGVYLVELEGENSIRVGMLLLR